MADTDLLILQQLQHTQRLMRSAASLGLTTASYERDIIRLQDKIKIDYLLSRTFARAQISS